MPAGVLKRPGRPSRLHVRIVIALRAQVCCHFVILDASGAAPSEAHRMAMAHRGGHPARQLEQLVINARDLPEAVQMHVPE